MGRGSSWVLIGMALILGTGCAVPRYTTKRAAFAPPVMIPAAGGRRLSRGKVGMSVRYGSTGATTLDGMTIKSALAPSEGDPGLHLPASAGRATVRVGVGKGIEIGGSFVLALSGSTVPSRAGLAPLPNMKDLFGLGPAALVNIPVSKYYSLALGLDLTLYSVPYAVYRLDPCAPGRAADGECKPTYRLANSGSSIFLQWSGFLVNNFHFGPVTIFLGAMLQNSLDNVGFDDSTSNDSTLDSRTLPLVAFIGVEVAVARRFRLRLAAHVPLGHEEMFGYPGLSGGMTVVF